MEQSEDMEKEEEGRCCMCGDVGFPDQLLPCPVCHTRSQHTYCSRMYPEIEMKKWQCEWCLHKVHDHIKQHSTMTITTTKLKKRQRDDDDKGAIVFSSGINNNNIHNTKKQKLIQKPRCNNNNNNNCYSSSPRSVNGRRYKLLSDVLC